MAMKLRYTRSSNPGMQPGAIVVPGLRGSSGSASEMLTFGLGSMAGTGTPLLIRTATPKLALCGPQDAGGTGPLPGLTCTGTGISIAPPTTSVGTGPLPGLTCTGTGTTFLGDCFAECPAQFNVTGANVADGGNCNFCNELINGHLFALFQFGAAGGFCNPPAAAPDTCSWSFFDGTFFSDDCLFADQFQLIFSVWGDLSINAWRIELSAIMARVGGDTQRITYSKTTTTPCVDITASFGPADICENVNDNLYCNMAAATWNVVSV